jgi:hypothetical protein
LEHAVCRPLRHRKRLVPDHVHQRPERQVALRHLLRVRGREPVQGVVTPTPTPTPSPTPSPTPTPPPTPDPGYIEGIDISHWQGPIDWPAVAASGREFAFMKASESTTYVDPTYPTNDAGARAAGLVVGAYHFARPDLTPGDAVAEADHFANQLHLVSGDLPPVLDLEQTGGLGVPDLHAWVEAFLEQLHADRGARDHLRVAQLLDQ